MANSEFIIVGILRNQRGIYGICKEVKEFVQNRIPETSGKTDINGRFLIEIKIETCGKKIFIHRFIIRRTRCKIEICTIIAISAGYCKFFPRSEFIVDIITVIFLFQFKKSCGRHSEKYGSVVDIFVDIRIIETDDQVVFKPPNGFF